MGKLNKAILASVLGFGFSIVPIQNTSPTVAHASTSDAWLQAERSGSEVRLTWWVADGESQVEILRAGQLIFTGTGDGFLQDRTEVSGVEKYEMVVTSEQPTSMQNSNPTGDESTSEIYENLNIVGVEIGSSAESIMSSESAVASPLGNATTLRYQTFIPAQYMKAPLAGCQYSGAYDYYKGDNRSFSTSSTASFRTRFDVSVTWASSALSSLKTVGRTHVYRLVNGSYLPIDDDIASKESMVMTPISTTQTKAVFRFRQDVGNPFCASNGIFFDLTATIYRSGSYSLKGTRLRVPNHEIYIKDSDESAWTIILRDPYLDFAGCLTPVLSGVIGCEVDTYEWGTR
ncbi:hypothetical protein [Rhodoluna limnophila]|uniref:hypothetical protein n=1 Tax=Rhodoluna limnophila TaxID=232537 RepID=UPI0015622D98|nr:hypothetical protein [Rhodoluna limnophila]